MRYLQGCNARREGPCAGSPVVWFPGSPMFGSAPVKRRIGTSGSPRLCTYVRRWISRFLPLLIGTPWEPTVLPASHPGIEGVASSAEFLRYPLFFSLPRFLKVPSSGICVEDLAWNLQVSLVDNLCTVATTRSSSGLSASPRGKSFGRAGEGLERQVEAAVPSQGLSKVRLCVVTAIRRSLCDLNAEGLKSE